MELIKRFVKRIAAILIRPAAEWAIIATEPGASSLRLLRYVAILSLIPALARFAGASLVGWYAPILPSLAGALVIYLSSFAIVYAVALAVDALAPRFGARKDFASALKLAVYSATPVWLAGIFLLVPGLSFLMIFGFYAAYILWCGLPILIQAPAERALLYAVAISLAALIAFLAFGFVEAPLFSPV